MVIRSKAKQEKTRAQAEAFMPLDKISSRIFVTLQYRDEDPIVEKTRRRYNRELRIRLRMLKPDFSHNR